MADKLLELNIEKIVYGGFGLARHGGKTYLVRYSAPREIVRAEVYREKKDYGEAVAVETLLPSNQRRDPVCPYYEFCGGCQFQHIDYDTQLKIKKDNLLESLERIAGLNLTEVETIPSPQEFGYRVRVQFKVKKGHVGFVRWDNRDIVSVENCPVAHPKINELIPSLRELTNQVKDLQEIHVLYSPTEEEFLIKLVTPTYLDKELLKKLRKSYIPPSVVGVGNYFRLRNGLHKRYFVGREYTFISVGDFKYRVSNDSFFQTNRFLWEKFANLVVDKAEFKKALELYCGVGFFTLPLAKKGNFIEGSDSNPSAINDAQYNAKLNGIENAIFLKSTAFKHLQLRAGEVLDTVVLDPPRSGLIEREIELLLENKPESIVYISCNPTTLARDIKRLSKAYRLEKSCVIDIFPQSYHVESVNFLRIKTP